MAIVPVAGSIGSIVTANGKILAHPQTLLRASTKKIHSLMLYNLFIGVNEMRVKKYYRYCVV